MWWCLVLERGETVAAPLHSPFSGKNPVTSELVSLQKLQLCC